MKELIEIQHRFSSTKNLHNEFANFDYRNLEVMLKDLKPILYELGCTIQFSDRIVCIGKFNYLEATCTITNADGESVTNTAYAREDESRAGNCSPQLSGMASTYCRRYALCGLIAVDSGEPDPDSLDNRAKKEGKAEPTYTKDMDGVQQFVKDHWDEVDNEGKRILKAYYNDCNARPKDLANYGPEGLYRFALKDIKDGRKVVEQVTPPGVDQKPILILKRVK